MTFADDDLFFWAFMSREEWQFCYSLSFSRQILELAPVTNHNRSFRDVLIEAQRDGHCWSNLIVDDDDRLHTRTDDPTEPENLLFIAMIQRGLIPDYEAHFKAAIEYARSQEFLLRHVETLSAGVTCLGEIDATHKAQFDALSQEEKDEIFQPFLDKAIEDAGGETQ